MMAGYLANWGANTALQNLLDRPCFLACHEDDPTPIGLSGTEILGGGYARQPISFTPPGNRARVSANSQTFSGMPEADIPFFGVWTDAVAGGLIVVVALDPAIAVPASGQLVIPAGDIALML